jgi:pimeloyl-ACP methyl ester carboxylesterase
MGRLALFLLFLVSCVSAAQELPQPSSGKIVRYDAFDSAHIGKRRVDVWLPDGFKDDGSQRYGVLYMHDGENLFDAKVTWNHQSWGIPEVLGRLIAEGKVPPTIVVGIWNAGEKRWREYAPMPAYSGMSLWQKMKFLINNGRAPYSDDYLDFLVGELKPFIDRHYPTLPDRRHTATMGSSMGGLISLYAIARHPETFGAAAGLSTHWPITGAELPDAAKTPAGIAFRAYLAKALPDPATHRIYYDHGTEGLDRLYEEPQKMADEIFKAKGYTQGVNWMSMTFPGQTHNEESWQSRVEIPLTFILREE